MTSRADALRTKSPHLIAELTLYGAEQGGRTKPIGLGFGCPCTADKRRLEGWDRWPLLGDELMSPGETRRVGFFFLSGERAVRALAKTERFYLWEGHFIGEARILPE